MKSPKKPKKDQQQIAAERRQTMLLDEEIEEQEERFRMMTRGKLGSQSLLAGAPRKRGAGTSAKSASSATGSYTGGGKSLIGAPGSQSTGNMTR